MAERLLTGRKGEVYQLRHVTAAQEIRSVMDVTGNVEAASLSGRCEGGGGNVSVKGTENGSFCMHRSGDDGCVDCLW